MLTRIRKLIVHRQPSVNNISRGPWLKGNLRKDELTAALEAPLNIAVSAIFGTPQVGVSSFCTAGTWTGNPTPLLSYQWEIDGSIVPGENKQTFTPPAGSAGKILTCIETARNIVLTVTTRTAGVAITA